MANEKVVWVWVGIIAVALLVITYGYVALTGNVVSVNTGKVVKIGFMGPLSGDAASYGESILKGVELAKRDSGLDVELVVEDSKCDGKEAVNAITKLISVDRVSAVVGEVCSGATLAAAPIAERNKVVMISASSTSPDITNAGEYIFRTVPSDALQGAFGADLVYNRGYRRLAILYSNEEYGVGFDKVLKDNFKGEVVASEAFQRGEVDLRGQLTKIKAKNPDAIYIISNSPDSAVAALQQIKELGIDAAVFGSEGLKSDDILEAGDAAEGLIVTSVSSGSEQFAQRHKEVYGTEPGPFAAQAYDAFMALANAIKQGATTGEEIKDALATMSFDGASGRIVFDENGDVSGNYDVYQVKNGKFVKIS